MTVIYTCPLPFSWCPVCGKVIRAAKETGLAYERRIAWFPRSTRREVIRLSGQNRVPILVEDDGTVLHESADVARHIRSKYGATGS